MQTVMLAKDDLNQKKHHIYSNGTYVHNGTSSKENGEVDTFNPKHTTFDKLIDDIKTNQAYRKEMALERLIGFYRIGSEIGIGNFSQVKLGLHLLTKGFLLFL